MECQATAGCGDGKVSPHVPTSTTTMVSTTCIKSSKIAGRLAQFVTKWQEVTSDKWVLDAIKHYEIELGKLPFQSFLPKQIHFAPNEVEIISIEIDKLLQKGANTLATHEYGEFVSNIFIRPKKDGTFRPIINLRQLNKSVAYVHFKMETIHFALQLIRPQCFMASIDLKDAYFTVPIAKNHRKYLRFLWQNKLFEFTCLLFGLACAPRVFTKIMKPLIASLRLMGHESCDYIDDALLIGATKEECITNVKARVALTQELGFIVNTGKSVMEPTKSIVFLGFTINSEDMTITIPPAKKSKTEVAIQNIIVANSPKIWDVARVVCFLVSCDIAVPYGTLFRRSIECEKNAALTANHDNFDARMSLSDQAKADLNWWLTNLQYASAPIHRNKPDFLVETDASLNGWGANCNGHMLGGQ